MSALRRKYVDKITITGGMGQMAQTIAFLLKRTKRVKEVTLYDMINTAGTVLDINAINSKTKIRAQSGKSGLKHALQGADIVVITDGWELALKKQADELLKHNGPILFDYAGKIANLCPEALVCLASPPINSLLPLFSEAMKKCIAYDAGKIFGVCALTEMRCNSILGRFLHLDPCCVEVPIIGGLSFYTSVPLFSKAKPFNDIRENDVHNLTTSVLEVPKECRKLRTAAPLSAAYAITQFIVTLVGALCGDKNVTHTAFVYSNVLPQVKYFASTLHFNNRGACMNYGMPKISDYELQMVENAIPSLEKDIEMGVRLFDEINRNSYKKELDICSGKPVVLKTPTVRPCTPKKAPVDVCSNVVKNKCCS